MKICLSQSFPLGRFHATPWKVFPYDDPYGEWPPSPWRLLRGLLARSHQWERENGTVDDDARKKLVHAFAASDVGWQLPAFSWRGDGLHQYMPAQFQWDPADWNKRRVPAVRRYGLTKVKDNFWLTGGESQPLFWILKGDGWDEEARKLLDACLARMTYFGRAESITVIRRVTQGTLAEPDCVLRGERTARSVPVLCPVPGVGLEQLQAVTDDGAVRGSTVPPGAVWKYAERPARPAKKSPPRHVGKRRKPVSVMQFALGSRVTPTLDHVALIANWFRGRVIRIYLQQHCGLKKGSWPEANTAQREAVTLLAGKSADGEPLKKHEHAGFGLYIDRATQKPTRLLAWRSTPFTHKEQEAIANAANQPFSLGYREKNQQTGKRDPWKAHCVPLDSSVPLPAGFDGKPSREWASMTPYVPPRHAYDKKGKLRPGESPEEQLRKDLRRMGLPEADIRPLETGNDEKWVKTHGNCRADGASNRSKRGFLFRLVFAEPTPGPIALGHSSHYGLGLFVPMQES